MDTDTRMNDWFATIPRETGTEPDVGNGNKNNTCAYYGRKRAWCTCACARRWIYDDEHIDDVHERMDAAWENGACLDAEKEFDATSFEQDDEIEVWMGLLGVSAGNIRARRGSGRRNRSEEDEPGQG